MLKNKCRVLKKSTENNRVQRNSLESSERNTGQKKKVSAKKSRDNYRVERNGLESL